MFAVPRLRQFVMERLTSAAEEIFVVFEKTIIEYEEQIDYQRKLLDEVYKPEVKSHRIEHQHVCEDQDQLQVCVQVRNSSLDQEDPEPAQIKEEEEELCISEEGEQLELKQETDDFKVTAAHVSEHSEDQTLNLTIEDVRSLVEEKTSICVPVQSSVVPEANSDQQLVSHNSDEAESQDQREGRHGDSTSTTAEPEQNSHTMSTVHGDTQSSLSSFKCHVCEKVFQYKSSLQTHMSKHTGEKPFRCNLCGKDFRLIGEFSYHMRIHRGEKSFICKICGKSYTNSNVTRHMRVHTGERPFSCEICGKSFRVKSTLKEHMDIHTGEKPFSCEICGNTFRRKTHLTSHMRIHSDEKPFSCTICRKDFRCYSNLKQHVQTH